ncbi:MAG: sulfatase-like hydrolase/transferase [Lentisphaerae bacterium]|nr:sulfatase-like hydrolase/transferase [Lentisphaerota bacterium]
MADKPNVLVFFCDQLRVDLLTCYGGKIVRTPNLQRFSEQACVFDCAHTPTAICSPARASLMTGLYPHAHHMFNNSTPSYSYCQHLRPDATMIQDWAAENTNYETAYFGKWHIGPIADLFKTSFQHTPEGRSTLPYTQKNSHWHPNYSMGAPLRELGGSSGTMDIPMHEFPDVVTADMTSDFLNTRDRSKPFLAFCAFPGPHSNWLVPDSFGIRYNPDDIPFWSNRHDPMEGKPFNHRKLRLLGTSKKDAENDATLKKMLACLFSYMELIDEQVGRVLQTLQETGDYDNTLIVFTADHGDMAGSHGFLSKGAYMYDEIYRIPLLIKPPGPPAPQRLPGPANLIDVTATCLHAMSGTPQAVMGNNTLQGQSLLPYMESGTGWDRQVNYCEYHGDWYGHASCRMVSDGEWKLVLNLTDTCEFYNLREDPAELRNRFYDPDVKAVRDRYFQMLKDEALRLKDGQVQRYDAEIEDQLLQG